MKNKIPEPQINLDVASLPTMTCIRCGNFTFNSSFVIKKISAIISPTGKETAAPIQVFTCVACGTILPLGGEESLDFISDLKSQQPAQEEHEPPILKLYKD